MVNERNDPDRSAVRARLVALVDGRTSREDVADWASEWVRQDHPDIGDLVVWRALVDLSGADLRTGPAQYLHGVDDFRSWLERLDAAEP